MLTYTSEEYMNRTPQISIYGKNTSVFKFVQLVGITSMLYTCASFLDPFVNAYLFWGVLDEPEDRTINVLLFSVL